MLTLSFSCALSNGLVGMHVSDVLDAEMMLDGGYRVNEKLKDGCPEKLESRQTPENHRADTTLAHPASSA